MPKKKHKVDENGLTSADRIFCQEYVDNGNNATQAYLVSHPRVTTKTANTNSLKLLSKAVIQAGVKRCEEKALYAAGVNRGKIIQRLALRAFCKEKIKHSEYGEQAALDKLCKIMKLYDPNELPPLPDGSDKSGNLGVVIYLPKNTRIKCA